MARDGSSGVLGTFQTRDTASPSRKRRTSVNVPPESTPIRQFSIVCFPLKQDLPLSLLRLALSCEPACDVIADQAGADLAEPLGQKPACFS